MAPIVPSNEAEDFMKDFKKHDPSAGKELKWDDEKYFADTKFVTNSHLKKLRSGGPQHLEHYFKHGQEQKDAFDFGGALHCIILEPDMFEGRYYAIDDRAICEEIGGAKPRATKKYKEWKTEIEINNASRILLSLNDMNDLMGIQKKLNSIPQIQQMLKNNKNEVVYKNTLKGIECKCKVDSKKSDMFIVDVKSMHEPVTPESFFRAMLKYGYDQQGAFYKDIVGVDQFFFIAVEKTYPYTVGIFELGEESYKKGREKYERALEQYRYHFIERRDEIDSFFVNGII